jgi:hypothetical protein
MNSVYYYRMLVLNLLGFDVMTYSVARDNEVILYIVESNGWKAMAL